MPTLTELPCVNVIVIEHEVGSNPLDVKGAGEAGCSVLPPLLPIQSPMHSGGAPP
jgi:CO/xanthine dehydrogenase Mo-binding subunit